MRLSWWLVDEVCSSKCCLCYLFSKLQNVQILKMRLACVIYLTRGRWLVILVEYMLACNVCGCL